MLKFWRWLKFQLGIGVNYTIKSDRPIIHPDQVDHETEMGRQCIAQCFNTGKPVIGNYKEDGTFEIKTLEWTKE